MKVVVHPDFASLEHFVRRVPQEDFPVERVFCNQRNTVVSTLVDGMAVVVKKYKRPTLFNRFAYTFFRPGKAKRAYRYACRLREAGIETAEPIGYVEVGSKGLFHTGYFISRYLPYPTLERTQGLSGLEKRWLAEDFITFTASLHRLGLVPGDYNPGNILYYKSGCRFHFALVDINRFHFGVSGVARCMRSFTQLAGLRLSQAAGLVVRYCNVRNWDPSECWRVFLVLRKSLRIRERMKRSVKYFLGLLP